MSDHISAITSLYRREVGRLTEVDETVDRKTAFAHVEEIAAAMYARGDLHIPVEAAIHAVLVKADEKDAGCTDLAIKQFAAGEYDLTVDGDPILEMVVTLGRGKRKLWKNFTLDDLTELDRLRYRNVASVQAAYQEWRDSYDALLPQLVAGGTIGQLAATSAAA